VAVALAEPYTNLHLHPDTQPCQHIPLMALVLNSDFPQLSSQNKWKQWTNFLKWSSLQSFHILN